MGQHARLVFDHELDSRPRRPVADWGGDEVFARTPRKRFKPVVVEDAHHAPRPHVAEPTRPRPHAVPERPAADAAKWTVAEAEPAEAPVTEEPPATGRRTVLITGHPGAHPAPRAETTSARRRPPRTVEERLGARPDRVAAWACGLGVTLILAAVATADAAPL
jgi:hypothetical protein